jgi:hypothetical protein
MGKITKKLHLVESKITVIYSVCVSRNSTLILYDLVFIMKGITTAFKINLKCLCTTKGYIPYVKLASVTDRSLLFM